MCVCVCLCVCLFTLTLICVEARRQVCDCYCVGQNFWLVNALLSEVLGESEKHVLFLLKIQQAFWPT